MKVCIVTVYNSVNSGSFWQAKALQKYLESIGVEVVFFKRKNDLNSSSSVFVQLITLIKKLIKGGPKLLLYYYKQFKEFKSNQKTFKIVKNVKELEKIDCIILGSDTIWNINDKYFDKNIDIYWGRIFENLNVISYAGSVGNTPENKIIQNNILVDNVNKWNAIGVRDEYTYKIIEKMTNKKIEIVCDPTLLLSKNDYDRISEKIDKKYIFLYLFESLTEKQIECLKEFAKEKKLDIIDGTGSSKFVDKKILNTPYNFLNYINSAEYIITDTFHGVVFSSNLQKKFIAIDRKKQKVNNYLKSILLENRLCHNEEELFIKLHDNINYIEVNKRINNIRNNSYTFLKEGIRYEDFRKL